jgi:L-threonylcarbamoyladenylate synthase
VIRIKGTPVLKVDARKPLKSEIAWAGAILLNGGLIAVPTDTVYGLAVDARNPAAIRRLYLLKGREPKKPLACLTAYAEQIMSLSDDVPDEIWSAAKKHWPGALTLVTPKAPWLPDVLTAGLPSVGVRYPNCPWIWELVEAVGFPLAVSSANFSTKPAAIEGRFVIQDWAGKIDMIVDAGRSELGVESTVAGMIGKQLSVFRQGALKL